MKWILPLVVIGALVVVSANYAYTELKKSAYNKGYETGYNRGESSGKLLADNNYYLLNAQFIATQNDYAELVDNYNNLWNAAKVMAEYIDQQSVQQVQRFPSYRCDSQTWSWGSTTTNCYAY